MSRTGRDLISLDAPHMSLKYLGDPKGPGSFFYVGGGNGEKLVSLYCMKRGWRRIQNSSRTDYKLKWCSIKQPANYDAFREGKQLLYQIPNNRIFTTKIGLLNCLRGYEKYESITGKLWNSRVLKMADFVPETYRLDVPSEREQFFATYNASETWICKPTGLNQGIGIFLLQNPRQVIDLRCKYEPPRDADRISKGISDQARIVQRYIPNPLLLGGRKFDVRAYMIIASTVPYIVFFRHGYVRLTCNKYDSKSTDLIGHLTNQYMQKKHPRYEELKEETIWSMERFNSYVNKVFASDKGLPKDWVLDVFTKKMQVIMTHCFKTFKSKLACRRGYFDLIGCDFLIDENFQVWLLEMNCNPSLDTSSEVQKEVIPEVVKDTLDLTIEIFKKSKGEPILPLKTQTPCVLLYNGVLNEELVKFNWPRNSSSITVQKEPVKNVVKLPPIGRASKSKCVSNRAIPGTSKTTRPTAAMTPVHTKKSKCVKLPPVAKPAPRSKTLAVLPGIGQVRNTSSRTAPPENPQASRCKLPKISKKS
ncbi:protein polyglycylase TTLL10-like [Spea bombifrons]|uniref:protein polyglycylase TTLL10-like n=1 Tax=Spea bombifrons TaxID=233779 RepID=UPI00234B3BF1|nr:protein polyglycylase TTLL10-like [Spea bombifrons]